MIFFFCTIVLILFISFLFVLLGLSVFSSAGYLQEEGNISYYVIGAGFFVGFGAFLSLWGFLTHVSHTASVSLFITLPLLFLCIWRNPPVFSYVKGTSPQFRKIGIVMALVLFVGLLKALVPIPAYYISHHDIAPFSGFGGVVHSFRAGNISQYIIMHNYFPVFNQHSGQSIIAALLSFGGIKSIQLSLVVWLNVFITFFSSLVYGFTRKFFNFSPKQALVPVAVILFGNTVLSPFYSSITDTESALFLTSNCDSLFGIATFLILFVLCYQVFFEKKNFKLAILLAATFGFIWNITAGEMIILFVLLLCCTGFFYWRKINKGFLIKIVVVFLGFAFLGLLVQGGMLYPSSYSENPDIKGLMMVNDGKEPLFQLRFPRTGEGNPRTLQNIGRLFREAKGEKPGDVSATDTQPQQDIATAVKKDQLVFDIARLVRSFQIVFFPLLGLGLFWFLKKKGDLSKDQFNAFYVLNASVLFFVGWCASTFFKLYGYYWELSKFLYAGCFLAMFALGVSFVVLLKKSSGIYRGIICFFLFFVLIGSVLQYGMVGVVGNFVFRQREYSTLPNVNNEMRTLNIIERFDLLVNIDER